MKLSVVIPVYNEINTFLELLRRVRAVPLEKEIIIVDDGSTDGTREVLKKVKGKNIKVFFNKENRGKGFSIRKGFKEATGDLVIIQDADLEYYPDEYPHLIERIIQGKADVVYGTRFGGTRRAFNFYHSIGNKFLNLIANFLYNTNLTDFMTCYKVFKKSALKSLNLRADGFGIEAEITAQLFKKGFRVYEVPISYDGRDFGEGKKIVWWKDFFRCVYWLLKCRLESDDVGKDTLRRMRLMRNNNHWLFEKIKPFLGETILEVGSGMGTFSFLLSSLGKKLVILSDIREDYLANLKKKFSAHPRIKVRYFDLSSGEKGNQKNERIETVVCLNVLEHIEDDERALKNLARILAGNGRLILLVPAIKELFGQLDKELGHYRRYRRKELTALLKKAGFKKIEKIEFHNFLGGIGWWVNSRLLKKKIMSEFQIGFFDSWIPLLAKIEKRFEPIFGLSLFVVARKK